MAVRSGRGAISGRSSFLNANRPRTHLDIAPIWYQFPLLETGMHAESAFKKIPCQLGVFAGWRVCIAATGEKVIRRRIRLRAAQILGIERITTKRFFLFDAIATPPACVSDSRNYFRGPFLYASGGVATVFGIQVRINARGDLLSATHSNSHIIP